MVNIFSDKNMTRFHENIRRDIERCGRSIVGVCGCEDGSFSFAYTIGNHAAGLPELLVIGTRDAGFLNGLSQQMIDRGAAFLDGQIVDTGGCLPVKIVCANEVARDEYTVQAGQHFSTEDYAVMQVLISDRSGKFPGEPGCQPPYSRIPVMALN